MIMKRTCTTHSQQCTTCQYIQPYKGTKAHSIIYRIYIVIFTTCSTQLRWRKTFFPLLEEVDDVLSTTSHHGIVLTHVPRHATRRSGWPGFYLVQVNIT